MARARNIKPSFFQNEQLGDLDPLERLAFIGLWTVADFKGCVELRPKRLKVQLLPYDDCDFEKIAINLDKSGLIRNYSVQGKRYLKIINFERHQNPHKNEREAGSDIPDICEYLSQVIDNKEVQINLDKSGLIRNLDGTNPADSLFPIPDSLNLIPDEAIASCSEPNDSKLKISKDDSKVVIELPLNKKGTYHKITENMVLELSELYPAVDVMQQFRNMLGWLNSNQEKRKTERGINAFINRWLSKAQDKGGMFVGIQSAQINQQSGEKQRKVLN